MGAAGKLESPSDAGEDLRLLALRRFAILDTPRERAFDDIVTAAAAFLDAPIALVSLVDRERQWFKACIGLTVDETPIEQSVCAIAVAQREPLIIGDLSADPRTAGNPLVLDEPGIRFYAGVPLITSTGHAIGSLCVIDTATRPEGLNAAGLRGLEALARQTTSLIELRHAADELGADVAEQRDAAGAGHRRANASDLARDQAEARVTRAIDAQNAGRVGTFEAHIDTDTVFVSPQFCQLFGIAEQQSYPAAALEALMLRDTGVELSSDRTRTDGSAQTDVEYRIRRPADGLIRWISRRARFVIEDGKVLRMIGTVHDVTERRLAGQMRETLLTLGDKLAAAETPAEAVAVTAALLAEGLTASRAGYAAVHSGKAAVEVVADEVREGVGSLIGSHPSRDFAATIEQLRGGQSVVIADMRAADSLGDAAVYAQMDVVAMIAVPLIVRGELIGAFFVHDDAARAWNAAEVEFVQGAADRMFATLTAIEADDRKRLLNAELSHRMKNMLSMVQAIANQTLRRVDDRAAVEAFDQRLTALSTAHDVLLKSDFEAADIATIARGVLARLGVDDRVSMADTDIRLGPKAALALSLMLHELATNAVKYGSLSVDEGRVALTWRIDRDGGPPTIVVEWQERGGPPASPPTRKGFGTRLLNMGLLGTGGAGIRYLSTGLEAGFVAPWDRAHVE